MQTHRLPIDSDQPLTLRPEDGVLPLSCLRGQQVQIEVLQGRLWLTQHGRSEDWFLERGQRMTLNGPARFYASADGHEPLEMRWRLPPALTWQTQPVIP